MFGWFNSFSGFIRFNVTKMEQMIKSGDKKYYDFPEFFFFFCNCFIFHDETCEITNYILNRQIVRIK